MSGALERLAWLLAGGVITLLFQIVSARLNEKRGRLRWFSVPFRGFPDFHKRLFFDGLTADVWESRIPPRLRDRCITFVFYIESVGRGTIKDLRVTLDARNGAGIVAHKFLVEKTIVCDRLNTETIDDKRLIAKWGYLNPGEELELHVLVTGIDAAENLEFGVDAEGIECSERLSIEKSLQAILRVGQAPMTSVNSTCERSDGTLRHADSMEARSTKLE
ncbi:MAG TPA: hypothetical protein VMV10_05170 [Pirellulales bacterium]|nr:hypothetical protein [Pirellulales bacterium]